MNNIYIIGAILVIGLVTFLLRALPFIAGRWLENNLFVDYIKDRFPMVMMFILTLYAADVTKMKTAQEFMPVFCATLATIVVHFLVRNFFLSIFIGVITYITLLHFIPVIL
jgi:branched-subunit amino acid transport protein AzlD